MMHGWGGPFGLGNAHMVRRGDRFEEQYHCYSMAYADKAHLEVSTLIFTCTPRSKNHAISYPNCFFSRVFNFA